MNVNFQQQTNEPLFQNLIWSRPETKLGAGKLLIIGGQAQEFIHVAECYAEAEKAGAGTVRVLMPDSTRKITKMLPNIEYAPSNVSGSFTQTALAELLDASQWSDGVLLAGDLGKNSETSLMLERFVAGFSGALIITSNARNSISMPTKDLFQRDNTLLILTFDEIQKIGIELGIDKPITSATGNPDLAQILHEMTHVNSLALMVQHGDKVWTSTNGNVCLTSKNEKSNGQLGAAAAVWSIQNPSKIFEAITTAAYC